VHWCPIYRTFALNMSIVKTILSHRETCGVQKYATAHKKDRCNISRKKFCQITSSTFEGSKYRYLKCSIKTPASVCVTKPFITALWVPDWRCDFARCHLANISCVLTMAGSLKLGRIGSLHDLCPCTRPAPTPTPTGGCSVCCTTVAAT